MAPITITIPCMQGVFTSALGRRTTSRRARQKAADSRRAVDLSHLGKFSQALAATTVGFEVDDEAGVSFWSKSVQIRQN